MKKLLILILCLCFVGLFLNAQITKPEALKAINDLVPAHELQNRSLRAGGNGLQQPVFNPQLAPFYHGVASGDPLSDRVIIWTRITPDNTDTEIEGTWYVCTDTSMNNLVTKGNFTTNADKDFTVKIDVTGLQAATTYYYMFEAKDVYSLRGRTRTAPQGNSEHLRFGVVSCSNYQSGYFNGYASLAQYNDLDAILHLGDYIYEYGVDGYGGFNETRPHEPETEILTLTDYRTRYSFYRLDEDLRALHQQFPFINIWDDHETANDAYKDGAQNHDPATEGNWEERKAAARKAFFEWIPIRGTEQNNVYRTLDYGNLANLVMLDTRLEGRDMQLPEIDPAISYSEERTILGEEQKTWFLENMQNSQATWKIVVNQVIFTPIIFGALSAYKNLFDDVWEAYPVERNNITRFFADNNINDIVVLTGDFHCSLASNIPTSEIDTTLNEEIVSDQSVGVEFMVPSVTSPNFNEVLGSTTIAELVAGIALNTNPHMSMFDVVNHGYLVLDITPQKAQADWYFLDTLYIKDTSNTLAHSFFTNIGENTLQAAPQAATPKTEQMAQAPTSILNNSFVVNNQQIEQNLLLLSIDPNPADDFFTVNFALNKTEDIQIQLYNLEGKLVQNVVENKQLAPGLYNLSVDAQNMAAGTYLVQIATAQQTVSRKIVIF